MLLAWWWQLRACVTNEPRDLCLLGGSCPTPRGPWKAARGAVMREKGLAASCHTSTASERPLPPLHLPAPATPPCLNPHPTEEETEARQSSAIWGTQLMSAVARTWPRAQAPGSRPAPCPPWTGPVSRKLGSPHAQVERWIAAGEARMGLLRLGSLELWPLCPTLAV